MSFNDLSPGAVFGIVFAICIVIGIVYAIIHAVIWHYINLRNGGDPEYFPAGGSSSGGGPSQSRQSATSQSGPQATLCPSVPNESV